MAVEVMLLFGVQAIYGYVYFHLALVVAAFMAGMGLGSRITIHKTGDEERGLLISQTFMLVLPPLLYLAMRAAAAGGSTSRELFAYFLVPLTGLLIGGCAGWQFPVASRLRAEPQGTRRTQGAGSLYALDLVGACAGAVLVSAWLLPVFGFARAATIIAAANAGPVLLALVAAARRR
jgi:predicted membrane-bound spermidine synthase